MAAVRLKIRVILPADKMRILLLLFIFTGFLCFPTFAVHATTYDIVPSTTTTHEQRQYYITRQYIDANGVWFACEEGYHFASLWELLDVSNLRYNATLGYSSSDSEAGPPTGSPFLSGTWPVRGWVRTGYSSSGSSTAGRANCYNWSTTGETQYGTYARLPSDWVNEQTDIGPWVVGTETCDYIALRVWCIEDSLMHYVMLPVVLK